MSDEDLQMYEKYLDDIFNDGKKTIDCVLSKKEILVKNAASGTSNLEIINGCFNNFDITSLIKDKISYGK